LFLLLPALELLLYPGPGLLPDGGHAAVLDGMTIDKTFLLILFIACLLILISEEVYFFLISYVMLTRQLLNIPAFVILYISPTHLKNEKSALI